jgi:hypothetical protein
MPHVTDPPPSDATRTARFAQFLRAAVAIKAKAVTEVNKYPTVVWFSNLPAGLDQIRSPLISPNWPGDDGRWLAVARLPEPTRPAPPDVCSPWLASVDLDSPAAPPTLNPHFMDRGAAGEPVEVPPTPEALSAWDRYLSQDWTKWSDRAALARTVKPVYQKLFAAHQELQGRADAYDLFVGVGLLDSQTDPAQRLRRHLWNGCRMSSRRSDRPCTIALVSAAC